MTEELRRGREVCFVYVDDGADPEWLASLRATEPNPSLLHVARSDVNGNLLFGGLSARWSGTLAANQLLTELKPDVVRVHNPSVMHIDLARRAQQLLATLVYDQMDLWDAFAMQPWGANGERWFLENADLVSTVSLYLANLQSRPGVKVIRNGVPEAFVAACRVHPLAGSQNALYDVIYAGALWPDWMDWTLIEELVAVSSTLRWCFVGASEPPRGEDHGTKAKARMLALLCQPNVTAIDEVPHEDLVGLLVRSRIGLVPFKMRPLTMAASPIKVYDYSAAGLPISCFATPEVDGIEHVASCSTPAEHLAAIKAAISSPPNPGPIQAWARDNSWACRLDEMDDFVAGHRARQVSVR